MVKVDDAEAIRRLAYEIWEREGRPRGREHEHWAEANREFTRQNPPPPVPVNERPRWNRIEAERNAVEALRRALWTPEPFSTELFGREAPRFGYAQGLAKGRMRRPPRPARPLPVGAAVAAAEKDAWS